MSVLNNFWNICAFTTVNPDLAGIERTTFSKSYSDLSDCFLVPASFPPLLIIDMCWSVSNKQLCQEKKAVTKSTIYKRANLDITWLWQKLECLPFFFLLWVPKKCHNLPYASELVNWRNKCLFFPFAPISLHYFVGVLQSSRLKLDPYLKASASCCYQQNEVNSGDNF